MVFGDRCFEANHWRKKTALAANSGGRDLLDGLPLCGTDTADVLCGRGEWKLLLLQAFQTGRRATNGLISIACHAAMSLRPAASSRAHFLASDPGPRFPNSNHTRSLIRGSAFRRENCHFYNIDHLATGIRSIRMPVATA